MINSHRYNPTLFLHSIYMMYNPGKYRKYKHNISYLLITSTSIKFGTQTGYKQAYAYKV